jgi:hypothetical protein
MLSVFSTYITSIFLEGIFFLLAGVFISSLIEVFVPQEFIEKLVPENRILGIIISSFTGLLFPVCECGIVPVAARLIKKGVPVSNAITMMLSIPLVNIIVFSSTHFAFRNRPEIALYRTAGGIIVSVIIGLIINFFIKDKYILKDSGTEKKYALMNSCTSGVNSHVNLYGCSCHGDADSHVGPDSKTLTAKIQRVFSHSIEEFFSTGKYFIIGILVTSSFQTLLPKAWLNSVGKTFPVSEIFMTGYAYILSICSQTDAFIARSFSDNFNTGALLCFMISGAMIDIKNTAMLKNIFRTRFIVILTLMIFFFTIAFSQFAEILIRLGA